MEYVFLPHAFAPVPQLAASSAFATHHAPYAGHHLYCARAPLLMLLMAPPRTKPKGNPNVCWAWTRLDLDADASQLVLDRLGNNHVCQLFCCQDLANLSRRSGFGLISEAISQLSVRNLYLLSSINKKNRMKF